RAVFPNLIAKDIVSVQPMTGPTSLVFYLDAVYGNTKGAVTAGDTMFSARKGHLADDQYSSESVSGESAATTFAGGTGSGTLAFQSARPGTVRITEDVGGEVFTDNGVGGLIGDATGTGSVNYATGAFSLTPNADPGDGAHTATANYFYNSEGSDQIPIVDINLSSVPVRAIPHKLRARWSVEAATNLKAIHGMDAEAELVALLSEKIRWDVDRRIISDLFTIASAGSVTWNKPAPAAVSYNDHKQTFIDALIEASNLIFRATRRGTGNFVVCGTNVANVVESLYGFRPQAVAGNGVVFIGTLQGRWSIYKDPYLDADTFLVGWKGSSFLEAGYVYAPYVPLYTTPTYVLDDMLNRKGMMSQYGVKAINGDFYAVGTVTYNVV
ncbi:MAG: hypothetical protein MJA29_05440, partial [Candidatus Omnitrophica bacterium]|nr:hypothetical protein [Candidatus Omnitrophota bacterium]